MFFSNSRPLSSCQNVFFEYRYHNQTNRDVYTLNVSKLSEKECHLFLSYGASKELLITSQLEFLTFHPANEKINDQFKFAIITAGSIEFFYCSFPKKFKDTCERVAKTFDMKMVNKSRVCIDSGGSAV